MAKPFRIYANSILPQPLSAEQTATMYGLSSAEFRRLLFVIKRLNNGKPVIRRARKTVAGPRKRGHK